MFSSPTRTTLLSFMPPLPLTPPLVLAAALLPCSLLLGAAAAAAAAAGSLMMLCEAASANGLLQERCRQGDNIGGCGSWWQEGCSGLAGGGGSGGGQRRLTGTARRWRPQASRSSGATLHAARGPENDSGRRCKAGRSHHGASALVTQYISSATIADAPHASVWPSPLSCKADASTRGPRCLGAPDEPPAVSGDHV